MSKIIQAINVMISNSSRITDVVGGYTDSEYFFIYDGKHKWSMLIGNGGAYYLHFYPGDQDLNHIAVLDEDEWDRFTKRVSYNTRDLADKEAIDSFRELYSILKEKAYGMDEVLSDIIDSDL
ncbi:hypothetical protein [Metapseudomonas resinovorans]|uniref:Uncharacterized protein n=1 Tax=Metapseudomonas resinovorans NBRC 106553 TaxID=1245471 RepID=S6APQ1_METRE|nr:hypothetical protein [Pseudomonas resinovorans]BAN47673.1 hypothetical protein PCA10_19410 [Pseudomonas resinovorans NBRC 106553]